ncbi:hypothetical protein OWR29_00220 [Actinoplanes sp. Pm04-4]|uniref:Uncharacterized protein n=1 Tax=Paractinoplanes pyxinae TaxID=2997416 RepID=A0ABT4AQ79_9ACTN|nr:hypothetical protein [Actinoplanes pyxinae]MCY1136403.1 hypothetical protein [Actinoplanes pyxinae]
MIEQSSATQSGTTVETVRRKAALSRPVRGAGESSVPPAARISLVAALGGTLLSVAAIDSARLRG